MKYLLCAAFTAFSLAALTDVAGETFRPKASEALLANPHMGWETFQRPAKADTRLPKWIPSTVEYYRWRWRDLEPRQGEIDWAFVDQALAAAAASGQTIGIRIMSIGSSTREQYYPDWLKSIPSALRPTVAKGNAIEVPDLDHPVVLASQLRMIRELGRRLDGDPRLDHVDIGCVGFWGEWHMASQTPVLKVPMPTPETRRKIVDAHLNAFRKTPVLMLIAGGDDLAYAASKGAGWRADCFGDLGGVRPDWGHLRNSYPEKFQQAGLQAAWRRAPVAYETCWDMRKWVASDWDLRYIFNYALATHASYLNNKSTPLPEGANVRPELERFLKRLGYRIVLREVDADVDASRHALTIASTWQNIGSAPCYRPYTVAWRLRGAGVDRVLPTDTSISSWMPGEVEVFTPDFLQKVPDLPEGPRQAVRHTLSLPANLPAGTYDLLVAVVDSASAAAAKPAIALAIEGRQSDGWYELGTCQIR